VQGYHNLCVVYVERGLLEKAEPCLQAVHKLAPNEDYIVRHLRIVQQRLAIQNGGLDSKMAEEPEPAPARDKDEVSVS